MSYTFNPQLIIDDMNLDRHPVWTAFYKDISPSEFVKKVVPAVDFNKDTHQDVVSAFKIIHRLLIYSYYEYEFIDVAVAKAFHTFEMALKLRYKEIKRKEWKGNLKDLLNWGNKNHLFEISDQGFLDHVRNARNHFSHPERYGFGGSAALHWHVGGIDQ